MVPLNMTQGKGKIPNCLSSVPFVNPPSIDESDLEGRGSSSVDRYSCVFHILPESRGVGDNSMPEWTWIAAKRVTRLQKIRQEMI